MPNPSQRLRVLFVCAMNKQRSATAEQIYRNDPRVEVRSAGVRPDAKRRISENDIRWAEVIFVMEREHKTAITSRFGGFNADELPPIDVLDIPDDFEFMDTELQDMLKTMLDPEIDYLISQKNAPN